LILHITQICGDLKVMNEVFSFAFIMHAPDSYPMVANNKKITL